MVGNSRKTAKEKQLHAINYNFTVLIFHYILSKQEAMSALGTASPNTMQGGTSSAALSHAHRIANTLSEAGGCTMRQN